MKSQLDIAFRALHLLKTLGLKCAAGYLRIRGCPVEQAVNILLRRRLPW